MRRVVMLFRQPSPRTVSARASACLSVAFTDRATALLAVKCGRMDVTRGPMTSTDAFIYHLRLEK
jgi:hypothetical protein